MDRRDQKRRIRRGFGILAAVVFLMALGAQTAFAATSYISSISITLDVSPVPGEDLPELSVGYTSDKNDEVMIPSNVKYDITSAKWSNSKSEVKLGGTYTMKITLEALNDYKFNTSYSSSKVTVKGGTFVSAQRQSSTKLVVTVKTKEAQGTLEAPDDLTWVSYKAGTSRFGYAKWDSVSNAAYDVYLYRSSKLVHRVTDLKSTTYNFYPYMTAKGTYTFRVRAVPADSDIAKYADQSEWVYSDELYVDSDEVSDGSGQTSSGSSLNISDLLRDEPDNTNQVGWIYNNGFWFFRYPDGTYLRDSWGKINGYWYLFDSSGVMLTGWQLCGDTYYYMNRDGAMQTGWVLYNGSWYYLKDDGAMATGWIQVGDKVYYLGPSGAMATGWQNVDGQIYYFYPDGHRAANEVVDGFYVDQNGVWNKP